MAEFVNPFSGNIPDRKMNLAELSRALRLNIAAEHEAASLYQAHADATDNPLAREVLRDIANEERQHIGEFQRLLAILLPDEDDFLARGHQEVNALLENLQTPSPTAPAPSTSPPQPTKEIPTIGSLRENS